LVWNWIPERKLIERSSESSLPWLAWVQRGLITRTQGNAVDYTQVATEIIALKERYKIKQIGFDLRNAGTVEQMLEAAGFTLVDMPQNVVTYNAPMKEIEALVQRGLIAHGNNEVLNWAIGNVVAWTDMSGNVRPDKRRSKDKIDPAVSIFMAMGRAMVNQGKMVFKARPVLVV
jgi:phage terminase large subunit-like protein